MHRLKRPLILTFAAIQLFVLLAAMAKPAYGYVDPGSGLLFFQVGGSMLAGALFMLRSKLRKLFGIKPRASAVESEKTMDANQPGTGA